MPSHLFTLILSIIPLIQRYGVRNLEESKKKLIDAASGAPDDHSLVFLAHNGPSGCPPHLLISSLKQNR